MATTYEPIATTTLGSAASTITFSSIPSTYTDLRLMVSSRIESGGTNYAALFVRFNNLGTTIYSTTRLGGDGTSAYSNRASTQTELALTAGSAGSASASGTFNLSTIDLFSYTGSTNKTALATVSADNNGSGFVVRQVLLARTTSAITRIDLTDETGLNFATGTTATLYGILKA
jgi:hypothetical protein